MPQLPTTTQKKLFDNFDCIESLLIGGIGSGYYYQLLRISFRVLVVKRELVLVHCVDYGGLLFWSIEEIFFKFHL